MAFPDPPVGSNLPLDAQLVECEDEARRLMDLADQEETAQSLIAWHDAHANMNKARNGFWEDPVKAHEADLYWSDDAIPASPQWEEPDPNDPV